MIPAQSRQKKSRQHTRDQHRAAYRAGRSRGSTAAEADRQAVSGQACTQCAAVAACADCFLQHVDRFMSLREGCAPPKLVCSLVAPCSHAACVSHHQPTPMCHLPASHHYSPLPFHKHTQSLCSGHNCDMYSYGLRQCPASKERFEGVGTPRANLIGPKHAGHQREREERNIKG
jgi:hypothetical protein